jgi:hypothetical protein
MLMLLLLLSTALASDDVQSILDQLQEELREEVDTEPPAEEAPAEEAPPEPPPEDASEEDVPNEEAPAEEIPPG